LEPEFKVESKNIDTAALEEELARRVDARRRAGVYNHEVESLLAERLPDEEDPRSLPPVSALDYAATRALASWEVSTAYPVETEKRGIGPLVIFAKRLARIWARVAVGPIQREQTAFNRHVAMALEALKREAIGQRAEALAAEDDLAALAGSMIGDDEARAVQEAVVLSVDGVSQLISVGPFPEGLLGVLRDNGMTVGCVSPGTSWDEASSAVVNRAGPLAFLSQVPEASLEAALLCELAFWLRPEMLVNLTRRAYLALEPGGRLVIVVHSFAVGSPAPAWCAGPVVTKALELAGFEDISITNLESGAEPLKRGYVAAARKR
jgi:hypothetical protein